MNIKFKKIIYSCILTIAIFAINACSSTRKTGSTTSTYPKPPNEKPAKTENQTEINVDGLLWYAKKQLGTPYKYGSADPQKGGFDCSGFLYYVYTHFDITVPRVTNDYMSYGKPVSKQNAQKGDVIIFTGSDAGKKTGGHVGIITENKGSDISFIHGSTSKGVVISKLSDSYYTKRFLKIVRVIK